MKLKVRGVTPPLKLAQRWGSNRVPVCLLAQRLTCLLQCSHLNFSSSHSHYSPGKNKSKAKHISSANKKSKSKYSNPVHVLLNIWESFRNWGARTIAICHPTSWNESHGYFLLFWDFCSIAHSIDFSLTWCKNDQTWSTGFFNYDNVKSLTPKSGILRNQQIKFSSLL